MESGSGTVELPVQTLYQRARHFWQDTLHTHKGKSILLVTHGGTGRALITSALRMSEHSFHCVQQSNCGISRLGFRKGGSEAQLELLNDTSHLSCRLPKLKEGKSGLRLLLIPAAVSQLGDLRELAKALSSIDVESVLVVGFVARALVSSIFPGLAPQSLEQVAEDILGAHIRRALQNTGQSDLRHMAVMASSERLKRTLLQQLALSASLESLAITGPSVTVVHYPERGVRPVLQAMNFFEGKFSMAGVGV